LLLRRRADQRPGLGARPAGRRVAARRRQRPGGHGVRRGARHAHRHLRRPRLSPRGRPAEPARARGRVRQERWAMKWRGGLLFLLGVSAVTSLACWRFLPRFVPPAMTPSAGEASAPVPENKLVVCYGYADLEEGITLLDPSQSGRVAEVP